MIFALMSLSHQFYLIILILNIIVIGFFFIFNMKKTRKERKLGLYYEYYNSHKITLMFFVFLGLILAFIPVIQIINLFIFTVGALTYEI
jgi:heme/copper-type cytochrome/quinol oxidase subunit 2